METTPDILAHCVRSFGDRLALRDHGASDAQSYSYRRMGCMAGALGKQLVARGAKKGAPVALLCENRPEWAIAYFAIHLSGAICVPMDTKLKPREVRTILDRTSARLLIVSHSLFSLAEEAVEGQTGIIVARLEDLIGETAAQSGAEDPVPIGCKISGDDTAVISFTSGTMGESKGVVLTHRNIAWNAVTGAHRMDIVPGDRLLSLLPLHHLFEQTGGLLVPLICGANITYPGSLNPRTILEAMRESGTTIALVVPGIARLFQKRILSAIGSKGWKQQLFRINRGLVRTGRRLRLSLGKLLFRSVHRAFGGRLRFFICGGAALDPALASFFFDLGLPMLQGYGLSETAPIVSCNVLREHVVGSVGRPLPGTEVKIQPVDEPDEKVGEIFVRGPNVMAGYFKNPQATAEVLRDGWLRTGDLGRVDERGYLYIVGRVKDVIVAESGRNIYPAEIEAEIGCSPHIREVCVVGVRSGDKISHREEVAALIVPNEETLGGEYSAEHDALLREEVRKGCMRLANYKRPRYYGVWPGEFPHTTTLKIKKTEVRKRLGNVPLKRV